MQTGWMRTAPTRWCNCGTPVNRFPDFVRYSVQRLQALCPTLGKKKLAEVLARGGLHLGATTIGRIQNEKPKRPLAAESLAKAKDLPLPVGEGRGEGQRRVVTAKRPNHVLHVDLTAIPMLMGLWCPWWPFSYPPRSPFCGWLALVVDHYSRRIMGFALFRSAPTSVEMRAFLGRVIRAAGEPPKHLISDKDCQFCPCAGYKQWCRRHGIKPRWGAVGKHGSIAIVERAIKTLKEQLSRFPVLPVSREGMRQLIASLVGWHNEHRPHTTLNGCTPNERYLKRFPANRRPRVEPRPNWPRGSPCALPHALVAGKPGARFDVEVERLNGYEQLPVIRLRRAA